MTNYEKKVWLALGLLLIGGVLNAINLRILRHDFEKLSNEFLINREVQHTTNNMLEQSIARGQR